MSTPHPPEPSAPFAEQLAHLIALLRQAPEQEAELLRAVEGLAARVAREPAVVEAGIENTWALDGDPLKERLLWRGVDAIRVRAGAPAPELLELAKALADDTAPIPSTPAVQVELIAAPAGASRPPPIVPRLVQPAEPVPRARPGDELAHLLEALLRELAGKLETGRYHPALHDAQAAVRLLPGLSEESRRTFAIALRRLLGRPVLQAFIDQAYRIPEEQARTVEVLRFTGVGGAEILLETLRAAGTLGPRGFLLDALGEMPEALPLLVPLFRSDRWFDLWLAAEVAGRLGKAETIPYLVPLLDHRDERVRHAAVDALGRFREKAVVEPLRRTLGHPAPATRARAARALAARGSGAMAMPLVAALDEEREPSTWRELLAALATIDAPEAGQALVRLALQKRGLFRRTGYAARERLLVVQALAAAGTPTARQALERIASEASGEVAEAARQALARRP
ncbi:MAG TPA: HEAT repeat domain-containing protein [Gemmatimonadales bacterium]|jgi:hypothetical protein|nr:HEAT repeat domain-containing protein [Gemmatimonadales bacterium]